MALNFTVKLLLVDFQQGLLLSFLPIYLQPYAYNSMFPTGLFHTTHRLLLMLLYSTVQGFHVCSADQHLNLIMQVVLYQFCKFGSLGLCFHFISLFILFCTPLLFSVDYQVICWFFLITANSFWLTYVCTEHCFLLLN